LYYYFCNGFLAYWLGDRDRAAPLIDEAGARIERIFSIPSTVELVLMELLVAAHRYTGASWAARLRLDWQMRRRLGKLRRWAQSCPQNFEAQYRIAVAQRASVRGDARADEHFATAVARAQQHGTAMREGLALQLHAEMLRARGRATEAAEREREAIDAFERWGAGALAARLRRDR
jgi:hypothetical protein